jgi:hypothetical protein
MSSPCVEADPLRKAGAVERKNPAGFAPAGFLMMQRPLRRVANDEHYDDGDELLECVHYDLVCGESFLKRCAV